MTAAIALFAACLALAVSWGYVSRELWTDPHKFWKRYRGRMARGRALTKGSWLGILYLDVFDFENNEQRYVLACRLYFVFMNLGILVIPVVYFLGLAQ